MGTGSATLASVKDDCVDQLRDYADDRLVHGCIYCDVGGDETRDHVPSRVLLDPPFPANLPVVSACFACNNSFAPDEEYLTCLIECAIAGFTDPEHIKRPRVSHILRRAPTLRLRIESAKKINDGRVSFMAEEARIKTVILKLARGHAAFELSWALRSEPISVMWWPISMMTEQEKESFDAAYVTPLWGEVGSRGMQRMLVTQVKLQSQAEQISTLDLIVNDWVDVQNGRYRYQAIHGDDEIKIKIIIAEFLACEITWAA